MTHVRWAFDLKHWRPSKQDLLLATACIQAEEKQRLARFVFREDFDASLVGRLMMRKFVNQVSGAGYDSIRFGRDSRGKPFWDAITSNYKDPANLHVDFNVSHQGSYSVLAGLATAPAPPAQNLPRIGVDIMKTEYTGGRSLDEFFRLMTSNFSDGEWRAIKGYRTEKERLTAFMRHWCLKESYVKNVGVGITIDLRRISFSTKGELAHCQQPRRDTFLTLSDQPARDWEFHEYLLDADHIVAVSVQHPIADDAPLPPFQAIDFDELMRGSKALLPLDDEYCQQVMSKEYKCKRDPE